MNEIEPSNIADNAPLTPGWKTSEFWMTVFGQASVIFGAVSGALPVKYAALAGVLGQVAYSLSRGIAKLRATY